MHQVSLVSIEEYTPPNTSTGVWLCIFVMFLTVAVVLPTPRDYTGTFQGGYTDRFLSQGAFIREQEGFCPLQKQPRVNTGQSLH